MFADDAVGRVIVDSEGKRLEIVGVVAAKPPDKDTPAAPAVYYYAEQAPPPFGRGGQMVFHLASGAPPATAALDTQVVSSGYFNSMGLSLDAGRVFPDVVDPDACRVAVINREAAERYFGGHAVGSAVIDSSGRRAEIVGVVRSPILRASQRAPEPTIYCAHVAALPAADDADRWCKPGERRRGRIGAPRDRAGPGRRRRGRDDAERASRAYRRWQRSVLRPSSSRC